MRDPKTFVLSAPKSGTHFLTHCLQHVGVRAEHEVINWKGFREDRFPMDSWDVDVSGFAVAHSDLFVPKDRLFMLVRHPVDVINSWAQSIEELQGGSTYFQLWKVVQLPPAYQLSLTWAWWMQGCINHRPRSIIHVESSAEVEQFCETLAVDKQARVPETPGWSRDLDRKPSRHHSHLYGWGDMCREAKLMAAELGYGKTTYCDCESGGQQPESEVTR